MVKKKPIMIKSTLTIILIPIFTSSWNWSFYFEIHQFWSVAQIFKLKNGDSICLIDIT